MRRERDLDKVKCEAYYWKTRERIGQTEGEVRVTQALNSAWLVHFGIHFPFEDGRSQPTRTARAVFCSPNGELLFHRTWTWDITEPEATYQLDLFVGDEDADDGEDADMG